MTDAIPRRPLGKTGALVPALAMGGHHLGDAGGRDEAIRLVHAALDAGIDFFDNCWEYWNGRTEVILGEALRDRRDRAFVMTKVCTHGRDAGLATRMLEESLRRLRTDHLDLWQIHGVAFDDDPDRAYAAGGVLEALDAAKRSGKTRFVGFTGHKNPLVHKRMLELGYAFDTVQMPLNCFDATFRSFEQIVLPEAQKRGVAVLGMKPFCGTAEAIKRGVVHPDEMLRYAMSLPVATTITGIDSQERLDQALAIARGFKPMAASDMEALRRRCAPLAADGRFELYKASLRFDNPQARIAHDFPLDPTQKEVKDQMEFATGANKR